MKKVIMIMFLFSSILLASCSMGGRLVLESSKDNAKARFQELVEIIQDDDASTLKGKFAIQTQNEIPDLYEQIEEMFEYIIGDIETWEMDSGVHESVSTSGGNKIVELRTRYTIQTSHDVYYIFILECTKDRFDSKKVGIFHTDRGSEFKNQAIDELLEAVGVKRSLSHKGTPYDNAVAEATYKTIKTEFVNQESFDTLQQLKDSFGAYVWWYNNVRLHSSLNYQSPVEYHQQLSL